MQVSFSRFLITVILSALYLAGCQGTQPPPATSTAPVGNGLITTSSPPLPNASERALPFDQTLFLQIDTIARTDNPINAQSMRDHAVENGADTLTIQLIDSRLAWYRGDLALADELLASLTQQYPNARFTLAEAEYRAAITAQWISAAATAHRLSLLEPQAPSQHRARVFNYLIKATSEQRKKAAAQAPDGSDWQGWLGLAEAYSTDQNAVELWQASHPRHPGNIELPQPLQERTSHEAPQQLALLLPMSGPLQSAGEAVLDGFIRELMAHFPQPERRPWVNVIDTVETPALEALVKAQQQGAELVVGPLSKKDVEAVGHQTQLPLPVIALNRPEGLIRAASSNWQTLSLAPEDEAEQIARLAFGRGLRRAVVLTPQGDWGARMQAALVTSWRSLGGQIAAIDQIPSGTEASRRVSELVGSARSDARIKQIEDAFNAPVEARPRRRQDLDVIFLLAPDAETAKTLRPLLVFHFAGDLPVFAPSTIIDRDIDRGLRDLNGVYFVQSASSESDMQIGSLTRLTALGADAASMLAHWQYSGDNAVVLFQGQTGLLTRQADGNITRELTLHAIDGDKIREISLD